MFTPGYRPCGPSVGISVAGTAHAAVGITATDTSANYLMIQNTSTTLTVFVNLAPTTASIVAATVPGDGTIGALPVLPLQVMVIPAPISTGTCAVSAIGAGAGPSLIVVTPVSSL